MRTTADWERIEALYRAGHLSIREIAKQCGCTDKAVRNRAKAEVWERDLTARVQEAVRTALVRSEVRTKLEAGLRTEREVVDTAVATVVEVVRSHRSAIAASLAMVRSAKTAVRAMLDLAEMDVKLNGALLVQLKDLSTIEKTYIGLERQAFGIRDDGDGTTDTYEDRLHRLATEEPA